MRRTIVVHVADRRPNWRALMCPPCISFEIKVHEQQGSEKKVWFNRIRGVSWWQWDYLVSVEVLTEISRPVFHRYTAAVGRSKKMINLQDPLIQWHLTAVLLFVKLRLNIIELLYGTFMEKRSNKGDTSQWQTILTLHWPISEQH